MEDAPAVMFEILQAVISPGDKNSLWSTSLHKKRTLSEKTCLPPARMLRTETSLLYRRVTKAPLDTQEKDDPPSLEIHSRTYL